MKKYTFHFNYTELDKVADMPMRKVGSFSLIADNISQANKMFQMLYGATDNERCSYPAYKTLDVYSILEQPNMAS